MLPSYTVNADHGIQTPDLLFRSLTSNLFTTVPLPPKLRLRNSWSFFYSFRRPELLGQCAKVKFRRIRRPQCRPCGALRVRHLRGSLHVAGQFAGGSGHQELHHGPVCGRGILLALSWLRHVSSRVVQHPGNRPGQRAHGCKQRYQVFDVSWSRWLVSFFPS